MGDIKETPLKETLKDIQKALADWDQIGDENESEDQAFRKRTRELLRSLTEQLEELSF